MRRSLALLALCLSPAAAWAQSFEGPDYRLTFLEQQSVRKQSFRETCAQPMFRDLCDRRLRYAAHPSGKIAIEEPGGPGMQCQVTIYQPAGDALLLCDVITGGGMAECERLAPRVQAAAAAEGCDMRETLRRVR